MTLRDQILSAADRPTRAVEVPEWGCTVHVRTMSAADRERIETGGDKDRWRERLLAACLTDDQGAPIFTPADAAALSEKSGPVIVRLARVAIDLNAIGEDQVEQAKNA
jgi:hypothetical protein